MVLIILFSQLSYAYDSRYVLSASVRRDGSSRFGPNNRWGTFPSVSAAWNIANEHFFKNITLISSLKLRASWGQLGNQEIGVYPYSSLVQTGQRVYSFGDKLVTGATIEETGNKIQMGDYHPVQCRHGSQHLERQAVYHHRCIQKKTSDILVR
ncbi:MAG: TonB-dependent receptor [Saprospiraceae bacterium]|nr:TonB-dependent receptor [Saprospiraceae bacterium]